ncbi:MAG: type II toxin-antitoxin system VapC family toxin [Allosphingosinicella sp.]
MIVVDASLAAKWILWEVDTPAALGFLRAHAKRLAAPDLAFVEVAGAIVRRGNMDKTLKGEALLSLRRWSATWASQAVKAYPVTESRLLGASSLALQLGTPLKDCLYLQLAMELECDLATCDVRFRDKAAGLYPGVKLLSEYAP